MADKPKKKSNPKDTVHVKTTDGYDIVVKNGSAYHEQFKKRGAVINALRPKNRVGSPEKDPLSVKNYKSRKKG